MYLHILFAVFICTFWQTLTRALNHVNEEVIYSRTSGKQVAKAQIIDPKSRTFIPEDTSSCGSGASSDLKYHGGNLLTGVVNLYLIFVGESDNDYKTPSASESSTVQILQKLCRGLNGSAYAKILTTYEANGQTCASQFNYVATGYYNTLQMSVSLTDTSLANIAQSVIQKNNWPLDKKGVFITIFRGDYPYNSAKAGKWHGTTNGEGGWCGFHALFSISDGKSPPTTKNLVLAPIGDNSFVSSKSVQAECAGMYLGYATPSNFNWGGSSPSCTLDTSNLNYACSFKSPNGNAMADSLANTVAHETFESVTDTKNGFYRDCDGYEIGDVCEATYNQIGTDGNNNNYNVQLSTGNFLLQTMLLRHVVGNTSQSSCSLSTAVYTGAAFNLIPSTVVHVAAIVVSVVAIAIISHFN